uniref:C-C motif chemokine n=1 Tax=Gasterosteus aculeatus aculeatus TaxID=481459 RepID=A0AAQ4NR14_GASAC
VDQTANQLPFYTFCSYRSTLACIWRLALVHIIICDPLSLSPEGNIWSSSCWGGLPSCCQKIRNTRIHRGCLKSYYKQLNPPCAKTAIVFITVKGKRICAAPENWWTKKSMAYLDRKKPATPTRTQHHCSPKLS